MFNSLCLLEALKVIITLNSKLSILNLQFSTFNSQFSVEYFLLFFSFLFKDNSANNGESQQQIGCVSRGLGVLH